MAAYYKSTLLNIAAAEVGYLEKASNSQLDDKTANAGKANFTKYARDLDAIGFYNGRKQGFAWCDVFVDWCFNKAFGKKAALALTYQPTDASKNCGAGCKYSRRYYQKKGRLFDTPEPGDQIFFWPADRSDPEAVAHTGLVYKVDSKKVYTIEGNTSGASGVIANGGGVCKKSYSLKYARIAGYGRPKYTKEAAGTSGSAATEAVKEPAQKDTGSASSTPETLRKGSKGALVKKLQRALWKLGYNLPSGVDGIFGNETLAAVKGFQKAKKLEVDGIVGPKTWAALKAAL